MPNLPIHSAPLTASDYARKARALFQLAGASDEPETRQLITSLASVHLAASHAAQAVRL